MRTTKEERDLLEKHRVVLESIYGASPSASASASANPGDYILGQEQGIE